MPRIFGEGASMSNHVATKMLPTNLIALIYANSSCYSIVTDQDIPGLTINLKDSTWNYQNPNYQFKSTDWHMIGKCNHLMKNKSCGVIGVYDRTITEHLSMMVRHWQEISNDDNGD